MPEILLAVLVAFLVGVLIHLWRKPKPAAEYGRDDGQADVQPDPYRTIADHARAHASRNGHDYQPGDRLNGYGGRKHPVTQGRSPAFKGKYGETLKPTVVLTPRMIEQVNFARKRNGQPALNRYGVNNAIAHPFDRPEVRQPKTTNDWLTYLILYQVFVADHQQSHCSGTGGFTIDPNLPYNGQGGEFAGAGASGEWNNAPAASAVASEITNDSSRNIAMSVAAGAAGVAAVEYDRAPSSVNPDPTPSTSSYTPDPTPSTPSYTSDPTPSYSSSSDSGGGGGGGE